MNILFAPLYSVDITHDYLSEKQSVADFFSIIPTRQCQDIIQRQGLIFRQTASGCCVFFEYRKTQISGVDRHVPIRPFPETCKMTFMLVPKLKHFYNRSNLKTDVQTPGVFRFSNINSNIIESRLYLNSQTGTPAATDIDRKLIRPKTFKEKVVSADEYVQFSLFDAFSPSPVLQFKESVMRGKSADPTGTACASIDLSEYDDGMYTLDRASETVSFYASDEISRTSAFGVIEILIHPEVSPDYQIIHPDGFATPKIYHLNFAARPVWWKFIVTVRNRDEIQASDLSIISPDSTIFFGDAAEESTPEEETCFSFTSNKKIPFRQKTLKGFSLVKSGSQPFSLENIANPASDRLIPHESIADDYYAESYIYI